MATKYKDLIRLVTYIEILEKLVTHFQYLSMF